MISPPTVSGWLRAPSVAIVSSAQRKPFHALTPSNSDVRDRAADEQHDEREDDEREAPQEGAQLELRHQWW